MCKFILAFFLCLISLPAFSQCRPVHILSAASNNSTAFTSSNGPMGLCGVVAITNTSSTTGLNLRFYDVLGAPVCSSSTGVKWTIAIPVATTAANVAGIVISLPNAPTMSFSNGVGICLTGAIADNDNTNAVTGVQVNFGVYGN
jgi:hypothetical protein